MAFDVCAKCSIVKTEGLSCCKKPDRAIRELNPFQIVLDRTPFNKVLELVRHLESGGTVPPIHVELGANGQWHILDGRHRVMAFRLLGRQTIQAKACTP
jgi:uncharacterized ParB-like nuclease family protein